MKILVATHNRGKLREFAELLAGLPIEWVSLDDVGITEEIEETGETFEANARLKAAGYARLSNLLTLADDSGLEVDALGGEPGVFSARYGGPDTNDVDRYEMVLEKLKGVPDERRAARFRCVVAVAVPGGELFTAEGVVEGAIAHGPRGSNGFGYDPIFWMSGYGATLAELGPDIKNRISHRGRAVQAIRPRLKSLIQEQPRQP
jgi:XTP/dITP diphosphohydrolase